MNILHFIKYHQIEDIITLLNEKYKTISDIYELYEKNVQFYKRYKVCKNCYAGYHEDLNHSYVCNGASRHISKISAHPLVGYRACEISGSNV